MKTWLVTIISMYLSVGTLFAATCDNGWYMDSENCVQCPADYPNSIPNAISINDCYLITNPGKYVAVAGSSMVSCATDYYCPGNIPVFYNLKSRYVRMDYIQSTGTQYIDTGIMPGSNMDTEMVFETGQVSGDAALFGSYGPSLHYWLNGYNNNAYIRYNNYHPESEYKAHIMSGKKLTLEIKRGSWILDNNVIFTDAGDFEVGYTGYLFAANRAGTARWPHPSLKVYSFIQWKDGNKVIDLVPVYDTQTGKYGMWDNVGGRFLGNIGTGEFLGGNNLAEFSSDGSISCKTATDGNALYSPIGSDDVSDCGYVMHLDKNRKLYFRGEKRTSPAVGIQIGNNTFYADTNSDKHGFLRIEYKGQTLSVYNMDVDD